MINVADSTFWIGLDIVITGIAFVGFTHLFLALMNSAVKFLVFLIAFVFLVHFYFMAGGCLKFIDHPCTLASPYTNFLIHCSGAVAGGTLGWRWRGYI